MLRMLTGLLLLMVAFQGHGDRTEVAASQQFGEAPDHPLVGLWMLRQAPESAGEPWVLTPAEFRSDRTVVLVSPLRHDRDGKPLVTTMAIGSWRPTGPRMAEFTVSLSTFDANGTFRGTVTIDGAPVVSASGQTFTADGGDSAITETDASGFAMPGTGQAGMRPPMMATRLVLDPGDRQSPCGPLLPFCE